MSNPPIGPASLYEASPLAPLTPPLGARTGVDVPTLTMPVAVEATGSRARAATGLVMTEKAQRVYDLGRSLHELAVRLHGLLRRRPTYSREIHGYLLNAERLALLATMMHAACETSTRSRAPRALVDATNDLRLAARGALDVLYPYEVSHPNHYAAVHRVANDILDLLQDPASATLVDELAADPETPAALKLATIQVALGYMHEAAAEVERTHRVRRLADVLEDGLDREDANAVSAARVVIEREHERLADTVEAVSLLGTGIDELFAFAGMMARMRLDEAVRGGQRRDANRVLDWVTTYFRLDAGDARTIREAVSRGTEHEVEEAHRLLDERASPERLRSRASLPLVGVKTALSWASLVVLATEPESRHTGASERLSWQLGLVTAGVGAASDTITLLNGAGRLVTGSRSGWRRFLGALADCAETVEAGVPLIEALDGALEGLREIDAGRLSGDAGAVAIGTVRVSGACAVALGMMLGVATFTGVGTAALAAAGALSTVGAARDAALPALMTLAERLLVSLGTARATDRRRNNRFALALGLDAHVVRVRDAMVDWGWWALMPAAPSGTDPDAWARSLREALGQRLRDEGFTPTEIAPLLDRVTPGTAPMGHTVPLGWLDRAVLSDDG